MPMLLGASARVGPAAALVELIAPWRDLVSNTGITSSGSAASTLGVALATCGRFDEASEAFEQGLAVNGALDAPILLARTHLDYGRMLLRSGDPERARSARRGRARDPRELGLGDIEREAARL